MAQASPARGLVARAALILGLLPVIAPGAVLAQDEAPLSAIDWLSQSVESPALTAAPGVDPVASLPGESGGVRPPVVDPNEAPVTGSAATPEISVRSLDAVDPDAIGLLPPSVTGLPASLWRASSAETLATLVRAENVETLPALRELFTTLLLAEADPPLDSTGAAAFFLARVDRLLDLGALEPAQALLEQADRDSAEIFRRWLDVTLLTGSEDEACRYMQDRAALAPTYPARIFCLARLGNWTTAAVTLGTARALGEITPEEDALLTRFLDSELDDNPTELGAPSRPSPLVYRLREAIGEPISANGLPRAFAHADMRPVAPWRSQIEAAERLARVGAVTPNVLFALYTRDRPSASGGIWERASAIQALERALTEGPEAVALALPRAWEAMQAVRAEVAFATEYAERLMEAGLRDEAAALAWRIALLSPRYESHAMAGVPEGAGNDILAAVALGSTASLDPDSARDMRAQAILTGFGSGTPGAALTRLLDEDRLGEALLRTLAATAAGLESDPLAVAEGLALLRRVGLEDTARRTALQYLILSSPT